MATVLGLHYGHDGSCCVVKDGRLLAAMSTERLYVCEQGWRHKKTHGVRPETLDAVMDAAGVTINDVDCIGLSDYHPNFTFGTIELFRGSSPAPCQWDSIYDNEVRVFDAVVKGKRLPAHHIGHQFAHCAAAYYTSNFPEAWCFSLDASGAKVKNNSLVAHGVGGKLTSMYCPGLMVGVAYGFFTEWLGLGSQMFKAGATMGLASYGKPHQHKVDCIDQYVAGCFSQVDNAHHTWMEQLWRDISGGSEHWSGEQKDSQRAMDVAATLQFIFEASILKAVQDIPNAGCPNLCLGGGSMLNCNVNSRLARESKFPNLFLFPGCTDDGGSIGAALYLAHHILNEPRAPYLDREVCYLGPDRPMAGPDLPMLARELADGKVVAWCCGSAEYGPRALGHRSILADPRHPDYRDYVGQTIKKREWFRPLAPIIMEEHLQEWFDWDRPSPFMLFTAKGKRAAEVPAVMHVDGTSRMQTVTRDTNRHMYDLLAEFKALTGVPMLLNTSMNVSGEPLVETDEHALKLFNETPVDILVLNGVVHRK